MGLLALIALVAAFVPTADACSSCGGRRHTFNWGGDVNDGDIALPSGGDVVREATLPPSAIVTVVVAIVDAFI
jgi:hypothetical protein